MKDRTEPRTKERKHEKILVESMEKSYKGSLRKDKKYGALKQEQSMVFSITRNLLNSDMLCSVIEKLHIRITVLYPYLVQW